MGTDRVIPSISRVQRARILCARYCTLYIYMNCERVFRAAQRNTVGNNNNNNILLPSADVTVLSENVERIIIIYTYYYYIVIYVYKYT